MSNRSPESKLDMKLDSRIESKVEIKRGPILKNKSSPGLVITEVTNEDAKNFT